MAEIGQRGALEEVVAAMSEDKRALEERVQELLQARAAAKVRISVGSRPPCGRADATSVHRAGGIAGDVGVGGGSHSRTARRDGVQRRCRGGREAARRRWGGAGTARRDDRPCGREGTA